MARRRRLWKARQNKVPAARLVFVDETWAKTNMTRTHGRCAKGQRLVAKVRMEGGVPSHSSRALRCDGIAAQCLLDGPIDAESFRAWVQQLLVPTLRPGDVVVMDNLSSHKDPAIRRAVRSIGAKLFYLPHYSPDLNPI